MQLLNSGWWEIILFFCSMFNLEHWTQVSADTVTINRCSTLIHTFWHAHSITHYVELSNRRWAGSGVISIRWLRQTRLLNCRRKQLLYVLPHRDAHSFREMLWCISGLVLCVCELSPGEPVDRMFLGIVTLSSELRAQSTIPLQPFIGKLMSAWPTTGRLWMLNTERSKHKEWWNKP